VMGFFQRRLPRIPCKGPDGSDYVVAVAREFYRAQTFDGRPSMEGRDYIYLCDGRRVVVEGPGRFRTESGILLTALPVTLP